VPGWDDVKNQDGRCETAVRCGETQFPESERTELSDGGFDAVIAAPVRHGFSYCCENSVPKYITLGIVRSRSTGGESSAPGGRGTFGVDAGKTR
jgi:hypothetical protein